MPEIIHSALLRTCKLEVKVHERCGEVEPSLSSLASLILKGRLGSVAPPVRHTALPANKNIVIKKASDVCVGEVRKI